MATTEPHELASSMMRMYGKSKALALADRYARDCTDHSDYDGHDRWASTTAVIGMVIEIDSRLGKAFAPVRAKL
jgi:hypothetical protein